MIRRFEGYPVYGWGISFALGGKLLVTPDSKTKAVLCWDMATGEHHVMATYPDEKASLEFIQAAPDGNYIAITTGGGPVRLVKVPSGDLVWKSSWSATAQPVFDEAGKKLLYCIPWRGVLECNRDTMHPEGIFSPASSVWFNGIALSPNGRLLAAVGGANGTVDLWCRDRLIPWREWSGLAKGYANRVAFTPDGKRLLSTHDDGTICAFKIPKDIPTWHGFPPLDPGWLTRSVKLPPDEQVKEVAAELARRNPGFNDPLEIQKDGDGQVFGAWVDTTQLEDLSPFRSFPALRALGVRPLKQGPGRVWDLTALKGIKLTDLDLRGNRVWDLSPLREMPLTRLLVDSNPVGNLSPLRSMKLQSLGMASTLVSDLEPLGTTPIETLFLHYTPVKNLSPLKGTPLKYLELSAEGAGDFESLRGLSIQEIGLLDVEHTGLTPAQRDVLRSMPTLKKINGKPTADFWKAIDAGEKPKPGG